jgi:predicted metal-dependent hydrolase
MGDSSTVEIDGVGPVLFERSKRAQRVNVSVRPSTGVRVAVPYGLSFKTAERFVRAKTDWIQRHLHRIRQYEALGTIPSDAPVGIERTQARRKLTNRLDHLARKHGFTYNRVSVRNQRTRWGSCSSANNISLNMQITRLPEELMDYVILHELAHTRVKNHSINFWAEFDKLGIDGRKMAARLRGYRLGAW